MSITDLFSGLQAIGSWFSSFFSGAALAIKTIGSFLSNTLQSLIWFLSSLGQSAPVINAYTSMVPAPVFALITAAIALACIGVVGRLIAGGHS